jgi:DNA-binding LytR/AlgR family response regulator
MKTQEIPIGGRKKLPPEDIILLEADINYTRLYLSNGESVIVATTLKKLEQRLVVFQNFVRSNKSYIINLDFMLDYKKDSYEIIMINQKKILVSRRRRNNLQEIINL